MYNKLKQLLKIRGMKLVIEIILILIVFFSVKWYTQRDLVNNIPPDFKATLLNGQPVNHTSLKENPVLLHFWASWCPVCDLEKDSIEAISKDHHVISVAMNSGTDMEVKNYLEKNNLSFPTIVDEKGKLAKKFGVRGVPVSFIINSNGEIAFTEKGFTTEYGLRFRLWLTSL